MTNKNASQRRLFEPCKRLHGGYGSPHPHSGNVGAEVKAAAIALLPGSRKVKRSQK